MEKIRSRMTRVDADRRSVVVEVGCLGIWEEDGLLDYDK